MKFLKKHLTTVVLVIAISLVTLFGAAAEPARITTNGGTLNVRKEAKDKSKVVTKLKNGTIVDVDEIGETWCHVSLGNKSGYVKRAYLKLGKDAVNKTVYAEEGSLFLRESPDSSSGIVAIANSQDGLLVLNVENEWAQVSLNGVVGYIPYEKISAQNEKPVVAAAAASEQAITVNEQKVYTLPDTKSDVLTTLAKGTYVVVSRVDNAWCLVSESGLYGYIPAKSLQLTGADVVNPDIGLLNIYQYTASYYTGTSVSQTLKMYTAPTANLDQVWKTITLQADESFKVLQRSYAYEGNTWTRIWLNDGTIGWILSSEADIGKDMQTYHYAQPISRGASAVAYVNEGGAIIYEEPSSLSAEIGTIPAGTEINIHVGEAFSSVNYQGIVGSVSNHQITFGFAISGKWQEEATSPEQIVTGTEQTVYDDTLYIRPADAQKKAASVLAKEYKGFHASKLQVSWSLTDSQYGISGPLYYVVYSDKKGNYQYGTMIHAVTGETLYTADYTSFSTGTADDAPATRKPRATATPVPDYPISKSEARKIADSALSSYGDFSNASITAVQVNAYSKKAGYNGPLWQVDYYIGNECAFQCIVHCETGEVLYKNDTWDAGLTEIDYSDPTPAPKKETGSYIGKDRARSIADRYLGNKYPYFNSCSFSNVESHIVEEDDPYFDTPYYQFDYYVDGEFVFEAMIHAVTGEVEYSFGKMPGEGNG